MQHANRNLIRTALLVCAALVSAAPALSAGNYALQFDGSDDYVNLGFGSSLHFTTEITLEAWIWAPPMPNDWLASIVSSQYDGNCSGASIMLDMRQNPDNQTAVRRHIHFQIGDNNCADSWHASNTNSIVPENQWVHIAATRKANEPGSIYYNGVLQPSTSKNWTGNITYTANWSIGRQQDLTRFFKGKIDEVRIWNRALTQAEVQDVMCRPLTGTETGLAGYWKLDEGTGTSTADTTGHGNTGTLINGPTWVASDLFTSIQPDAQIRIGSHANYTGAGVYNDLASQTVNQTVPAGVTAIYYVKLLNNRVAPDRFAVTGTTGGDGWAVQYFDETIGSTAITSQIPTGWTSQNVASQDYVLLRIEVTAAPGTAVGSAREITLWVTSSSDPAKTDAVKAITTVGSASAIPFAKTYTVDADFDLGAAVNVEHQTVHDQLQLATSLDTLPFIWIPNSGEGSVSKLNTITGKEVARYRVCGATNAQCSRTTIDQMGNCWVANRQRGTAVKIGLLEAGQYVDRNGNGVADTSRDLNNDGEISGAEMLPWGQDECVIYEVIVIPGREGTYAPGTFPGPYADDYWNPGPRGVAIDRDDNVWIGTYNTCKYYQINNSTGQIVRTINTVNHTAYGALVDRNGILWSSGNDKPYLLRLDPTTGAFTTVAVTHYCYGLGIDNANHLFVSGWQDYKLSRFDLTTGAKQWTISIGKSKGIAVTPDGDVWTGNYDNGVVSRWSNDGVNKANIPVGFSPTGLAVDSAGKVWALSEYDETVKRIDPTFNWVDLTKRVPGSGHYGYSDMTGIISRNITARVGSWTITHDSCALGTQWGIVLWTANTPAGTSVTVRARSSDDLRTWSSWETAGNGVALAATPAGRFLQVEATIKIASDQGVPVLYDLTVLPKALRNSVPEAKSGDDGDSVYVGPLAVTAAFDGFFYVEEDQRYAGIRVVRASHGLAVGNRTAVYGATATNPDGERYIDALILIPGGSGNITQLGMTNAVLGGAGLSPTGLLVTAWGKVTQIDQSNPKTWFRIDDGFGKTIKCVVPSGVSISQESEYVSVTGAASCEKLAGVLYPVVLVRTGSDVVPW